MFGELIGVWCAAVWQTMGEPRAVTVAELGPGRGTLMADALRAWRSVPKLLDAHVDRPDRDEPGAARDAKADAARLPCPAAMVRVASKTCRKARSSSSPTSSSMRCPCGRWCGEGGVWHERCVDHRRSTAPSHFAPEQAVDRDALPSPVRGMDAADGAIIETRPAAASLLSALAARAKHAPVAALIADYGHDSDGPRRYAAGGQPPSLRRSARRAGRGRSHRPCRFRRAQGGRDKPGLAAYGPMPQGEFLLKLGLEARCERLLRNATPEQKAAILSGAARLADPRQMGLLFKMLGAAIERACPAASVRRQLASDCAPRDGHTRQNEALRVEPRGDRRRAPRILHAPGRRLERHLCLAQLRAGLARRRRRM